MYSALPLSDFYSVIRRLEVMGSLAFLSSLTFGWRGNQLVISGFGFSRSSNVPVTTWGSPRVCHKEGVNLVWGDHQQRVQERPEGSRGIKTNTITKQRSCLW